MYLRGICLRAKRGQDAADTNDMEENVSFTHVEQTEVEESLSENEKKSIPKAKRSRR